MHTSRLRILMAAHFALLCWVAIVCILLSMAALSAYQDLYPYATVLIFIASIGLIYFAGISYLILCTRCFFPNCGGKFLKNSHRLGGVKFKAHPNCKETKWFSAWSREIVDIIFRRKFTCIHCGETVNLADLK